MLAKAWTLIKNTVSGFLADDALSRGAAIAYFTIFSLAPLLIIVTAIAGLVFGYEAARLAIVGQFTGMIGEQTGAMLQSMIASASLKDTGAMAAVIGAVTLMLTASGAFSQIQSSLNAIWRAEPKSGVSRLVRARLVGLGLVLTLGFLMLASLVVSAGLAALGHWLDAMFPAGKALVAVANFVISLTLLSAVFAAIYKFLPDTPISWRDVAIGAVVTALLFTIGRSAIGLYIGKSNVAAGFGPSGSLIALLVWIYYSSLIFLLGAEFTRAFSELQGSRAAQQKTATATSRPAAPGRKRETEPEPVPAARLPSEILLARTDLTRANIAENWRLIRDRIPNPALPDEIGRRPSVFQVLVAMVAVFTLPPRLREEIPPPIAHRRIGTPVSRAAEARRLREQASAE
jgi:membrane protein